MRFDHVAICVECIQESVEWYCKELDAALEYRDETWAMLKIGDHKVALILGDLHPPHIAFSVSDIQSVAHISEVKSHRDGSKFIYKKDPSGNIIEILQY
tara:strand:+ start:1111 stop:1407 length:297 start_codon:yes stop_codon:yes gene_type:complete